MINDLPKNNTKQFICIGTGGDSNHIILNHPYYVVKQHNGFGFLGIEINGKGSRCKIL